MLSIQTNALNTFTSKYKQHVTPVLVSKKGQAYTMLVLSLLTMAFFGFFALRPTLSIIARLQREIVDSRAVDDALSKKISSLSQIQTDYDLIRGALPALNRALPYAPELPQLLITLERVAQVSEASISGLSVSEVVLSTASAAFSDTKTPSTTIALAVKVSGSYERVIRFLRLIVSNPRIVRLESMSLTPSIKEGGAYVEMNAQVKGFYFKN